MAEELADIREKHAVEPVDDEAFFFRVLGGVWTRHHKGSVADAAGLERKRAIANWRAGASRWYDDSM